MWVALVVAVIDCLAVGFMVRFLIALLREGAPSICYWVVLVRREPEKEGRQKVLNSIYRDGDCSPTKSDHGDYRLELLENENYAKEECASGLIALDVRPVSDGVGWRPIHPRRVFSHEHRL
jgi:hypothetical protein